MKYKKVVIFLLSIILIIIGILTFSNLSVLLSHTERTDNVNDLPDHQPCLVLGTSKYLIKGGINAFYSDRMHAAADAYHTHKCESFVVSGNHLNKEARRMRESLINFGVPAHLIQMDQFGARTINSVLRFKDVYGYSNGIVISQGFHNQRAIYIAKANHIHLIGFDAPKKRQYFSPLIQLREILARTRAFFEVNFYPSQLIKDEISKDKSA